MVDIQVYPRSQKTNVTRRLIIGHKILRDILTKTKPLEIPHHVLYQHCRFPNQLGTKHCFTFLKKYQFDYFSFLQGCRNQMLVTTGKTFNSQQKLFRYLITQLQCKQSKCQNLKTQFPKDLIYGSANNKRIFSKESYFDIFSLGGLIVYSLIYFAIIFYYYVHVQRT